MPEGDTVFRTAASLREALVGKTLTRCDIRVPRYATVDLSGLVVDEVLSRGKHLFIRVGPASIHSHLKMDPHVLIYSYTNPYNAVPLAYPMLSYLLKRVQEVIQCTSLRKDI